MPYPIDSLGLYRGWSKDRNNHLTGIFSTGLAEGKETVFESILHVFFELSTFCAVNPESQKNQIFTL